MSVAKTPTKALLLLCLSLLFSLLIPVGAFAKAGSGGTKLAPAPANLKVVEAKDSTARVTWSPVKGAASYVLSVQKGKAKAKLFTVRALAKPAFTTPTLIPERGYTFRVKAVLKNKTSTAYSAPVVYNVPPDRGDVEQVWNIGCTVAEPYDAAKAKPTAKATLYESGLLEVSDTGDCMYTLFNPWEGEFKFLPWNGDKRVHSISIKGVSPTCMDAWFFDCHRLRSLRGVAVPSSVKRMDRSFQNCTSLGELEGFTLPSSVTSMNATFANTGVSEIKGLKLPANLESMWWLFGRCQWLESVDGFVIPPKVKDISWAFEGAGWLTKVNDFVIPDSVTQMNGLFAECDRLGFVKSLVLPSSVVSLKSAFEGCTALSGTILVCSTQLADDGAEDCFKDAGKETGEGSFITLHYGSSASESIVDRLILTNGGLGKVVKGEMPLGL